MFTRLCLAVIAGAVCALTVKRGAPEISFAIGALLTAGAGIFGLTVLTELLSFVREAAALAGLPKEWLEPMLRSAGAGILSRLTADLTRDAGQAGAASAIELCGSVMSLYLALPLLWALLELLRTML